MKEFALQDGRWKRRVSGATGEATGAGKARVNSKEGKSAWRKVKVIPITETGERKEMRKSSGKT